MRCALFGVTKTISFGLCDDKENSRKKGGKDMQGKPNWTQRHIMNSNNGCKMNTNSFWLI